MNCATSYSKSLSNSVDVTELLTEDQLQPQASPVIDETKAVNYKTITCLHLESPSESSKDFDVTLLQQS